MEVDCREGLDNSGAVTVEGRVRIVVMFLVGKWLKHIAGPRGQGRTR